MSKAHLLPAAERDYLETVQLKTELVNNLSKTLLNNHGPMSIPKENISQICNDLYAAAEQLVTFCVLFASKHPGSDTDKFSHTQDPASTEHEQIDHLMQLQILLSSHVLVIFKLCTKRQTNLSQTKLNSFEASHAFNGPQKTPKTFDEKIKIFLVQMKEFMKLLHSLSQEIKSFSVTAKGFSNTSTAELICKGSRTELEKYNQHQQDKSELLRKCDTLHLFVSNISSSLRSYITLVPLSDKDALNIKALISKHRSTTSHIICLLKSSLLNSFNEQLMKVSYHSNTYSTEGLPSTLKNNTLFHISSVATQESMLNSQTKELEQKLSALQEQLSLVQSCTRVKQMRLHQLQKNDERILDFEVSRHQREERWEQEESSFIQTHEAKIKEIQTFINENAELLAITRHVANSAEDNETVTTPTKKHRSLKRFMGQSRNKKENLTSSGETKRPSPEDLLASARYVSTPNLHRTSSDDISECDDDPSGDTSDDSYAIKGEVDPVELICERTMIARKIDLAERKLKRLQEQLDFRKTHQGQIVKKSSAAASKVTSELTAWIKQKQLDTLEELRDLHKSESTLSVQLEKLENEIQIHQQFLVKHSQTRNSNCSEKMIYFDVSAALHSAIKSFNCQYTILLESLVQVRPQFELMTSDTTNIWKESLVSTGNNKTVIFCIDADNEDRVQVRAGTLNQLVMQLTDGKRPDLNFMKTFITTFQSFTTPDLLFQKLLERYDVPRERQSDIPDEKWKQDIVLPIQIRVYNAFRNWLDMRFPDFDYKLMAKVNDFIDRLRNDGDNKKADALSTIIKRKISQQSEAQEERKQTIFDHLPSDMEYSFLLEQDSMEIAKHLTLFDSHLYRAIQAGELIDHQNSKTRCPNMSKMIERFNLVSSWVAYMIVCGTTHEDRVATMSKLIQIAADLRSLNNFNGLLSFIGGINNSAVYRLKKTREAVPEVLMEKWESLCILMKGNDSYKLYRETLHSIEPPVVPYIGVYLQDLTFINDGNPNNIEGLINFRKRELIYRVIEEFQQYQQVSYSFKSIQKFNMFVSCMEKHTEEELFEFSTKAESK